MIFFSVRLSFSQIAFALLQHGEVFIRLLLMKSGDEFVNAVSDHDVTQLCVIFKNAGIHIVDLDGKCPLSWFNPFFVYDGIFED